MCISGSVLGQSDTAKKHAVAQEFKLIDMKVIGSLDHKYESLQKKLASLSKKSLVRMQKTEEKLRKKLKAADSLEAGAMTQDIASKYSQAFKKLSNPANELPSLNNYLPGLDSMQTAFRFLMQSKQSLPGDAKNALVQLNQAFGHLNQLQSSLQSAETVKQFIRERREQLKGSFEKLGIGRELKKINKQVYYYQEQLKAYKALIKDPQKLEGQVLSVLRQTPLFKDFMAKNSLLARLFPMPAGYGSVQAIQGLQSRTSVGQQLAQRIGTGTDPQQFLQQHAQQAEAALAMIKDKINQLGGGNNSLEMPDFKPNSQKTKSFWKRMEYGMDIQSQTPNSLLPVTTDVALSFGYKLNDNIVTGMGAGYKIGWGKSLRQIAISSQGLSFRSYFDIKIKGSIWMTGGYEYNYNQAFHSIEILRDISAWQKSGLIGLTKKYSIGKKKGKLQLLWDFLSYEQVPRTQPLKFRIGYIL